MMKSTAQIVSVKTGAPNGFRWRWTSDDGKKSAETFAYYHDCVEDARNAGYDVYLQGCVAQNLDGSARTKV